MVDTLSLNLLEATVEQLKARQSNCWDYQKVCTLLNPLETTVVFKIPLSLGRYEDKWIWSEEHNGKFSVRSAYSLIYRIENESNGDFSTSHELVPVWKEIWKMRVLHKIHVFAWSACREGLSCQLNLHKKGLNLDRVCLLP